MKIGDKLWLQTENFTDVLSANDKSLAENKEDAFPRKDWMMKLVLTKILNLLCHWKTTCGCGQNYAENEKQTISSICLLVLFEDVSYIIEGVRSNFWCFNDICQLVEKACYC